MSLVRLLSAGKSLVGLKESTGRYNLSTSGRLPRFEPKKNPFRRHASGSTRVDESPQDEAPRTATTGELVSVQDQVARQAEPKVTEGEEMQNPVSKLFGLFSRWGAKSTRRLTSQSPALVQGELSLDRVKVVRNDLSDSDLEIVTSPSAPRKNTPTESAGPMAQAVGPALVEEPSPEKRVNAKETSEPSKSPGLKVKASAMVGRFLGMGKP